MTARKPLIRYSGGAGLQEVQLSSADMSDGPFLTDAPSNGTTYGRNNGAWTGVTGGSGSITAMSVVAANGFTGSVANPTTTPAITIGTTVSAGMVKSTGTGFTGATAGTDYVDPGNLAGTTTTSQGAGLVGYNSSLTYPANTVGAGIEKVYTDLASTSVSAGASLVGIPMQYTHQITTSQSPLNIGNVSIFRWLTATQITYATSYGLSGSSSGMGTNIQNAINDVYASGGGTITFPAGLYDHQGITIVDQVSLEGVGGGEGSDSAPPIWSTYRGTVLRNTAATNSINIVNGTIDVRNVRIRNLRITSTGSALIGINAQQWGNLDALQGVVVDSHVTGGMYLYQCWDLVVRDCWIVNNTGYGATVIYQSNAIVFDHTIIMGNGTDGLAISSSDNIVVTNGSDFEASGHNHIHVVTGPVRGLTVRDSYFETVSPQVSGYAGIRIEASTTDTALITGNYWDGSNGTSAANAVTFLDVETGNSRVTLDNLSFSSGNSALYSSFVSFKAGAGYCVARVAAGSSLAYNASNSCRIYYDPYTETGINAGNGSTQTFPATTWTAALFSTVSYDTKSEWNTGSGTFTPKDYGLYEIEVSLAMTVTAGDNYQIRLYDTTGAFAYAAYWWQAMTVGVQTLHVTFKELLGPANTLQVQVFAPASRTTNSSGGVAGNWIRIHRAS